MNARKAGTTVTHGDVELPVFATVAEAMAATGADVSIAFVPPAFTKDAVVEAIDAEIPLLVVITEGVPVQDSAEFWAYAKEKGGKTRIIGPNCPGIITPGEALVGITPAAEGVGPWRGEIPLGGGIKRRFQDKESRQNRHQHLLSR